MSRLRAALSRVGDLFKGPEELDLTSGGIGWRPIVGWGLVAAGAGVAAASFIPGGTFQDKRDAYDEATASCTPPDGNVYTSCDFATDAEREAAEDLYGEMQSARTVAYALRGAGAAIAAVGVVILVLEPESNVQAYFGPTGGGMRVRF